MTNNPGGIRWQEGTPAFNPNLEPIEEPWLIDCKSCLIVHAVGDGRNECIDGDDPDLWFREEQ